MNDTQIEAQRSSSRGLRRFKHAPLDTSQATIRLLRLQYQEYPDAEVELTIDHFDFHDCPPYCAVSYTWGPPSPVHDISINRDALSVRENLYFFIKTYLAKNIAKLRTGDRKGPQYLWIDQICIDQEDIRERNHQVHMMDEIFRCAKAVLIWLGVGDCNSIQAMHCIKHDLATSDDMDSVKQWLLSNPYWTRSWIVQEILLARKLEVLCGNDELSFSTFQCFWYSHLSGRHATNVDGLIEMRQSRHFKKGGWCFRLFDLFDKFGKNQCDDPRDKVFSVQGLLAKEDWQIVDYNLSTEQVWLNVCGTWLVNQPFSWSFRLGDLDTPPDSGGAINILVKLGLDMGLGVKDIEASIQRANMRHRLLYHWRALVQSRCDKTDVARHEHFVDHGQDEFNRLVRSVRNIYALDPPSSLVRDVGIATLLDLKQDLDLSLKLLAQVSYGADLPPSAQRTLEENMELLCEVSHSVAQPLFARQLGDSIKHLMKTIHPFVSADSSACPKNMSLRRWRSAHFTDHEHDKDLLNLHAIYAKSLDLEPSAESSGFSSSRTENI